MLGSKSVDLRVSHLDGVCYAYLLSSQNTDRGVYSGPGYVGARPESLKHLMFTAAVLKKSALAMWIILHVHVALPQSEFACIAIETDVYRHPRMMMYS